MPAVAKPSNVEPTVAAPKNPNLNAFLMKPLLPLSSTLSSRLIGHHLLNCYSQILCPISAEQFLLLCSQTFSCILGRTEDFLLWKSNYICKIHILYFYHSLIVIV